MHATGSLIVVDIDRTGVFPADQLAFAMGCEKAVMVDTINEAISALSARKPVPRYMVADIGLHGEDMLTALASLAKACDGNAQLIVIGNVNDLTFYRTLRSLGVHEYFTHPVSTGEVRVALMSQAHTHRQSLRDRSRPGTVIAFMSAASGDGSSTVALNMSYALAEESEAQIVLCDLDYQFGMIARHLDLQAQFGIRELFDYPERGVDATLLSKMLMPYHHGLNLIAAPDALRIMPQVRPDTVHDLIAVLKSQFEYVVLDVPHIWAPWVAEALMQSDRIVIVAQLWLRSLTHLSRLLAACQEANIDRDKIALAINRSGARFREAITPQDFEKVCLKSINYYFANDIKTVVDAENQGKTIVEIGSSLLERQMRDMARGFCGKQPGESSAKVSTAVRKGAARKGLRTLFSQL